jgi:hypothetical protein
VAATLALAAMSKEDVPDSVRRAYYVGGFASCIWAQQRRTWTGIVPLFAFPEPIRRANYT